MGPWKDMMDMGKGGDIGLAQETENETEISQNKTPKWHVFFWGVGFHGISPWRLINIEVLCHVQRLRHLQQFLMWNPNPFGHQLAEQNGEANVGETSSWLEKVRTEYGVLRKRSALYLWNPDWLWLISSLIKRWLRSAKVTGDLLWNDANQERNIQWCALERNCEDYPCKLWCTKKKVNVKSLKLDFFYVHIVLSCFFVPRLGKIWSSNGLIDALQILQPSCNKEKRTQYARYRPYDEEHTHVCLGFVAFC